MLRLPDNVVPRRLLFIFWFWEINQRLEKKNTLLENLLPRHNNSFVLDNKQPVQCEETVLIVLLGEYTRNNLY